MKNFEGRFHHRRRERERADIVSIKQIPGYGKREKGGWEERG